MCIKLMTLKYTEWLCLRLKDHISLAQSNSLLKDNVFNQWTIDDETVNVLVYEHVILTYII